MAKTQNETKRIRNLNRVELTALWVDMLGCDGPCGGCDQCSTTSSDVMLAQVLAG